MSNGLVRGEPGDDGFYVIHIEGDFDASLRDRAIAATEVALKEGPDVLLIDVKRCTFLDSTAIAAILGARQRAMDAGISFAMIGHNPTVDRVLELTGLGSELVVLKDRKEAARHLAA